MNIVVPGHLSGLKYPSCPKAKCIRQVQQFSCRRYRSVLFWQQLSDLEPENGPVSGVDRRDVLSGYQRWIPHLSLHASEKWPLRKLIISRLARSLLCPEYWIVRLQRKIFRRG